ncbi:hypothetical protein BZM26_00885 [Paraburkholderia strydomiana]|nr:hypothetical protein BZM26_00885 [Paraburkholderia strydomiana]
MERFGIKITVVEPSFFRTELVSARSAKFAEIEIGDYKNEENPPQMMESIHGRQAGDPDRLGAALVSIAAMENPPRFFAAGSDSLTMIIPEIEARLTDTKIFEA